MPDQVFIHPFPLQSRYGSSNKGPSGSIPDPAKGESSLASVDPGLRKACAELESLFIHQLLKEMRATVPKSGFLSGGSGKQMYTSMIDVHLARKLSSQGGIGLSSILMNQLAGSRSHGDERGNCKK